MMKHHANRLLRFPTWPFGATALIPLLLTAGCSDDVSDESEPEETETFEDASVEDSSSTPDASVSQVLSREVDADGARLELATLVLIIPPLAIEEPQVVTLHLSQEGSEVPSAAYSERFDIEPEDLTLSLSATVEIEIQGAPRHPVLVLHVAGQPVTLATGSVTGNTFTTSIDHFGSLYLADAAELATSEQFANDPLVIALVGEDDEADAGVPPDASLNDSTSPADAGPSMDADTSPNTETSIQTTTIQSSESVTDAGASDPATSSSQATETADSGAPDVSPEDAAAEPLEPGALPPEGYLTSELGPFANLPFDYFYLEDFEDGELNQPGVTASTFQLSSSFGTTLVDSVDGDDGNPTDNQCVKIDAYCDALWAAGSVTFTFDSDELGAYPTHAGAVWTDGEGLVGFEAFGLNGEIIYAIEPFSEPGFPGTGVTSDTAEDRFFGVYAPEGVTAIRLYNTSGGVEVDHLQYGRESQGD